MHQVIIVLVYTTAMVSKVLKSVKTVKIFGKVFNAMDAKVEKYRNFIHSV